MSNNIMLIDCQVFQTPAWDRGMGKYSLYLLREMYNTGVVKKGSTKLLFNSRLETSDDVRNAVKEACPGVELAFIDLLVPKVNKIMRQKSHNEVILSEYIDNLDTHRKVDFLILSLFLDQACPAYPRNARKLLVFYDLIPLMYFRRYLGVGPAENYLGHYKTLLETDIFFTISETVANDLTAFLGISPKKIVNINGASISRKDKNARKPQRDAPKKKFILMPSGGELRKNNYRAVQGFESFNRDNGDCYQLVLTSSFGDGVKKELRHISSNLVFTGNISESELKWLYEKCDMVLFASEYEGLGLPILEAVEAGKKVACSNIPVFREISQKAFSFFDHLDPEDIAYAINSTINSRGIKEADYNEIITEYTWPNSVKLFIEGADCVIATSLPADKKRIAVIAPSAGSASKAAQSVTMMHNALSDAGTVDYFFDNGEKPPVRPDYLQYSTNVFSAELFDAKRYRTYDEVIYHLCNDEYSALVLKAALCFPGRAIMYDDDLSRTYNELQKRGYINESRVKVASAGTIASRHIQLLPAASKVRAKILASPSYKLPYRISKKTTHIAPQVGILVHKISSESLDWLGAVLDSLIDRGVNPRVLSMKTCDKEYAEFLKIAYSIAVYDYMTEYDFKLQLGSLDSVILYGFNNAYVQKEIMINSAKYDVKTAIVTNAVASDTAQVEAFIDGILSSSNEGKYREENKQLLQAASMDEFIPRLLNEDKAKSDFALKLRKLIKQSSSKQQVISGIDGLLT